MLDKIKEIATQISELLKINEQRGQDLLDFIEWGILYLPENFKTTFESREILSTECKTWRISFTTADYLWWKAHLMQHLELLIPPISKIKKDILNDLTEAHANLLLNTATDDLSLTLEEIKKLG